MVLVDNTSNQRGNLIVEDSSHDLLHQRLDIFRPLFNLLSHVSGQGKGTRGFCQRGTAVLGGDLGLGLCEGEREEAL